MISLADYKKALGSTTQTMSEEKIDHLRRTQDLIAEAIFNIWIERKNKPIINTSIENTPNK